VASNPFWSKASENGKLEWETPHINGKDGETKHYDEKGNEIKQTGQQDSLSINGDTLKIQGVTGLATTKPFFQNNCVASASNDTLYILASSDYAYYPFGKIFNEKELKQSLLKNLETKKLSRGGLNYQFLNSAKNKLILSFDTIEQGVMMSYIVKGEIKDSTVSLLYNIHVGMSSQSFLKTFFDTYPQEILNRVKVLVIQCCAIDIIHTYTFNNGILGSIIFTQDGISPFKIDYLK